ncbi:hypothetical protein Mal15_14030 [Stieleria maiorica]|uniref:Uncharacterized protein n=1 Tax=Stieleria maiorica TaxID=2795974 RepID=A0A5B9M9K5_9BACT|nr:hypothetical protein [Stieleria maiorica]QEF97363.1 hypothetical protein Mal15_14030 [Stieleria maiorica]
MKQFDWIVGCFSTRQKSLRVYNRGISQARQGKHDVTIQHYATVIGNSAVPEDVKAMSPFNRTLAYANVDDSRGATDLNMVLKMRDAPPHMKTGATRKLARMQQRAERRSRSHD